MPKRKQPIMLVVTPEGEKHFQRMVAVGYVNLPSHQHIEWNILHDLIMQGTEVKMSTFLTEGRNTILGRTFANLPGSPAGELATENYGKTLHQLIKQGYIKASRPEVEQK